MSVRFGWAAIITIMALAAFAHAATLHVRAGAPNGGNGASWATAYNKLDSALAVAAANPGTEIWVAEGTYLPAIAGAPPDARTRRFSVPSGTVLLGGFAGSERSADERDPDAHPTILSGDLGGNDQAAFVNRSDNAYNVVIVAAGAPLPVLIDGFVVRGGNANAPTFERATGGGIRCSGTALTLRSVRFTDNLGVGGAAGWLGAASFLVENCRFDGNACYSGGDPLAGYSGTLHVRGTVGTITGGTATIVACDFTTNGFPDDSTPEQHFGSSMSITGNASATIDGCVFTGNKGRAGTVSYFGSATDGVTLRNSTFKDNVNWWGSAGAGFAQVDGVSSIVDCHFIQNLGQGGSGVAISTGTGAPQSTIESCTFFGNAAADIGGAIALIKVGTATSPIVVRDSSFELNASGTGGGAIGIDGGVTLVERCTFGGNSAKAGGAVSVQALGTRTIRDSFFLANFADTDGGALHANLASVNNALLAVERSRFIGNVAIEDGGACYLTGQNSLTQITDSLVANGWAWRGGAMYVDSDLEVTRSTIARCQAGSLAGGIFRGANTQVVPFQGTILAGNSDPTGEGLLAQVRGASGPASWTATYSLFPVVVTGLGNVAGDPGFLSVLGPDGELATGDEDFGVDAASPCVNGGDPYFRDPDAVDALGLLRVQACRPDIGAIESPYTAVGEPDWDGDGITDQCEIVLGLDGDCDEDLLPDGAEVALGAEDCNADGVPDACQLLPVPVLFESEPMSPVNGGMATSVDFGPAPKAIGTVTFTYTAKADIGSAFKFIQPSFNGITQFPIFNVNFTVCPPAPVTTSKTKSASEFNEVVVTDVLSVSLLASPAVSAAACPENFIRVTVSYVGRSPFDKNHNGVMDACELLGDVTGDGVIDGADLATLLAAWGPCASCASDLDVDGDVDAADLAILLTDWS